MRQDRVLRHVPAPRLRLEFEVLPHGWATFVVVAPRSDAVAFRVSYVSDALGDLVRAAVEWSTGDIDDAVVEFHGEPSVTRLAWHRTADGVRVDVGTAPRPGTPTTTAVEAVVADSELMTAVVRACAAVDRDAYALSWPQHPFPDVDLARLESAGRDDHLP